MRPYLHDGALIALGVVVGVMASGAALSYAIREREQMLTIYAALVARYGPDMARRPSP